MDELCRVVLWKPTAEHDPRSGLWDRALLRISRGSFRCGGCRYRYPSKKMLEHIVVQQIAPNYATYAEKLAAGANSVLAQLSPADFQTGIDAMRANDSDKPVCEPIDVFVFHNI